MRNLKIIGFALLVLAQLYVPFEMIQGQEKIISEGKAFKFKTAPIDPNDPFRGKYIWLTFDATSFPIDTSDHWQSQEEVYVLFDDSEEFVKIASVSTQPPTDRDDYLQTTINYVNRYRPPFHMVIDYPFDRFYMEESKALAAEQTYAEVARDSSQVAYALVYIKDGSAVLENVFLNDVPIQEVVKNQRLQE